MEKLTSLLRQLSIKVREWIDESNIDYFKTASGVYANLEFDGDIQIKGFGKDEKDALENLENELEEYLKYK